MNLYTEAARIIKIIDNKRGSIKALVFASQYPNIRQLYALVCESLKYKSILQNILQKCGIDTDESLQDTPLLSIVLLYDHLLGKGLKNAGVFKKAFLKHDKKIAAECDALLEEKQVTSLRDLVSEDVIVKTACSTRLPRYIRVNLLAVSVQEVLAAFQDEGWKHNVSCKDISNLKEDEFMQDTFFSDVLIFPPGTELHDHSLYHDGSIVLQDRASCFPAHVLDAPENSVVIDCCAAPGNKTSHIASLMGNTGKIYAFDRDRMRLNTMKTLLVRTGVENAELFCKDFLSVKPDDPQFSSVEYILVDPSCSGSGIVTRLDYLTDGTTSKHRLTSLSNFQSSLLKHALKFPSAKRVVYSTCSIHSEENEKVIEDVLRQVSETFTLKKIFPKWPMRGNDDYPHGDTMIRLCPEKHFTNGFFVACFERIAKGDNSADSVSERKEVESEKGEHLIKKTMKRKRHSDYDVFCEQRDEENCETITSGSSKKRKKKKEEHLEENEDLFEQGTQTITSDVSSSKKKLKKKHKDGTESLLEDRSQSVTCGEASSLSKKQNARKRKLKGDVEITEECAVELDESVKKLNPKSKTQKECNSKTSKYSITEGDDVDPSLNKAKRKKHSKDKNRSESCTLLLGSDKSQDGHFGKCKKLNKEIDENVTERNSDVDSSLKKAKKKKTHSKDKNRSESCTVLLESDKSQDGHFGKCEKLKKEMKVKHVIEGNNESAESDEEPSRKKKRRHHKSQLLEEQVGGSSEDIFHETSAKKKKKKSKHKHCK